MMSIKTWRQHLDDGMIWKDVAMQFEINELRSELAAAYKTSAQICSGYALQIGGKYYGTSHKGCAEAIMAYAAAIGAVEEGKQ